MRADQQPLDNQHSISTDTDQLSLAEELHALRMMLNQQFQLNADQNHIHHQLATLQQQFQQLGTALEQIAGSINQQGTNYTPLLTEIQQQLHQVIEENAQLKEVINRNLEQQSQASAEQLRTHNQAISGIKYQLQAHQDLIAPYFDWKYLAAQLLLIGVVTASVVIINLRLFPPKTSDSLLNTKLEIIYREIQQLRKEMAQQ